MSLTNPKYDELHISNTTFKIEYSLSGPEELLVFLGAYAYKNLVSVNLGKNKKMKSIVLLVPLVVD